MIHCCNTRPPPRSCSMAGKARLITLESRNATIDTITATTIARLVGAASRNVTAGAVRRVTMTGRQTRGVRWASAVVSERLGQKLQLHQRIDVAAGDRFVPVGDQGINLVFGVRHGRVPYSLSVVDFW